MNMKNKILIFICFFSLMLSSCSDSLLEKEPTAKLTGEVAFKNANTLKAFMNGLYNQLTYNGDGALYTQNLILLGDILGEDMVYGDKWYRTYGTEYAFKTRSTSWGPKMLWSQAYYAIEMCNNLLKHDLSKVDELDSQKADEYRAVAKTIRAMITSDIVRFFGKAYREDKTYKANPYVTEILYNAKDPDDITYVKKSTVEEVYTMAIKDLNDAIALGLPQKSKLADAAYITEQVAHALLSRLYLDMAGEVGNKTTEAKYLPLAKSEAEKALVGSSLMSAKEYWEGGLSTFNSESILTFAADKDKMYKWRIFQSFHDNYDGMGDDFVADLRIVEGNDWFKTITKKFTIGGNEKTFVFGDMRQGFFVGEVVFTATSYFLYSGVIPIYRDFDAQWFKVIKENLTPYSIAARNCGYYMYGKFPRKDRIMGGNEAINRGSLGYGDYSYIRASEMELTIAECEARLGINESDARSRWKKIASRLWYQGNTAELGLVGDNSTEFDIVYANELTYTGTDLINLILKERRKEFLGEGHRFRDILRLGTGVIRDIAGTGHYSQGKVNIPANSIRLVFPVPQHDVDANDNMDNNGR
ncbi:RagB/SusD family nutrient uptake outer membrane protein [Marinilabiliaceae bacterium JC040]|nr:RagB/SusD family nutrient uptake outer membrane protein [Marinilabiliaceae bacterium JC040]